MTDLSFKEMQEMQRELQETYKEKWGGLYPKKFHTMMLYLFAEAGEAVDVVKKNGTEKVLNDEIVRTHFIEEMADVLMYFNDVLLCCGVTPEEFAAVYRKKHQTNLNRW